MHRGQLIADGVLDDLRTDAQAEVKFQLRLDPGHLDAIVNSLPAHAHHHSNEESSIEIVLPAHEKMPLLKSLLAHDYVRDIKIRDEIGRASCREGDEKCSGDWLEEGK